MNIRLLAIDMDGTYLRPDRTPHPENEIWVRKAISNGVHVVFATGRSYPGMKPFADAIEAPVHSVVSNGARTILSDGRELDYLLVPDSAVECAVKVANELELHVNLYTRNELYFVKDSEWGEMYKTRLKFMTPLMAPEEPWKHLDISKSILIGSEGQIQRAKQKLGDTIDHTLAHLVESEPEYIEVLDVRANKARGISLVAQEFGIPASETAAVGDYYNDLEMIEWAGIGAAMAGAPERVRSAASVVLADNSQPSVAEFIRHYVLGDLRNA